jgi:hypothetical protein
LSVSRREAWRSFFSILQYSNTPSLQNLANKWTAGAPHKPNPVPVAGCPATGDDHSSLGGGCPTPLATYPGARAGSPPTLPYLVLHRVGFAELPRSPEELVRSYRTVSPLPRLQTRQTGSFSGRYTFCCTFLRVTATPRYGAPCPVVFGLSSGQRALSSDRLCYSDRPPLSSQ